MILIYSIIIIIIIIIPPIYVLLLGTSVLSQWKGLGCSFHATPVRIENFTSLICFVNDCRFPHDIFLHRRAHHKFNLLNFATKFQELRGANSDWNARQVTHTNYLRGSKLNHWATTVTFFFTQNCVLTVYYCTYLLNTIVLTEYYCTYCVPNI